MNKKTANRLLNLLLLAALALLLWLPLALQAQATPAEPQAEERITWFGTWQDGLAEARRSGRPILLMAGAVQCHGVSGTW